MVLDAVETASKQSAKELVQKDCVEVNGKVSYFFDELHKRQTSPVHVPHRFDDADRFKKVGNPGLWARITWMNGQAKGIKTPETVDRLKTKTRSFSVAKKSSFDEPPNLLHKIGEWPGPYFTHAAKKFFNAADRDNSEGFKEATNELLKRIDEAESILTLARNVLYSEAFINSIDNEDDRKKLNALCQTVIRLLANIGDPDSAFARLKNLAVVAHRSPEVTRREIAGERRKLLGPISATVPPRPAEGLPPLDENLPPADEGMPAMPMMPDPSGVLVPYHPPPPVIVQPGPSNIPAGPMVGGPENQLPPPLADDPPPPDEGMPAMRMMLDPSGVLVPYRPPPPPVIVQPGPSNIPASFSAAGKVGPVHPGPIVGGPENQLPPVLADDLPPTGIPPIPDQPPPPLPILAGNVAAQQAPVVGMPPIPDQLPPLPILAGNVAAQQAAVVGMPPIPDQLPPPLPILPGNVAAQQAAVVGMPPIPDQLPPPLPILAGNVAAQQAAVVGMPPIPDQLPPPLPILAGNVAAQQAAVVGMPPIPDQLPPLPILPDNVAAQQAAVVGMPPIPDQPPPLPILPGNVAAQQAAVVGMPPIPDQPPPLPILPGNVAAQQAPVVGMPPIPDQLPPLPILPDNVAAQQAPVVGMPPIPDQPPPLPILPGNVAAQQAPVVGMPPIPDQLPPLPILPGNVAAQQAPVVGMPPIPDQLPPLPILPGNVAAQQAAVVGMPPSLASTPGDQNALPPTDIPPPPTIASQPAPVHPATANGPGDQNPLPPTDIPPPPTIASQPAPVHPATANGPGDQNPLPPTDIPPPPTIASQPAPVHPATANGPGDQNPLPPTDIPPPPTIVQSAVVAGHPLQSAPPTVDSAILPKLDQDMMNSVPDIDLKVAQVFAEMNLKPSVLYMDKVRELKIVNNKTLIGRIENLGNKMTGKVKSAAKRFNRLVVDFHGEKEAARKFEIQLVADANRNDQIVSMLSDLQAKTDENWLEISERQKEIGALYQDVLETPVPSPQIAVDNFITADGGNLQGRATSNYFKRISDHIYAYMTPFGPRLPEVGENLSPVESRNNRMMNKAAAISKLAGEIEPEIVRAFPDFTDKTDKFILRRKDLMFWKPKSFGAKEVFAFMVSSIAMKNLLGIENLFDRIGNEATFQAAAGEVERTLKRQFDLLMVLTLLLTDEEYIKIFPDKIRASVREYGRWVQEFAVDVMSPGSPFRAAYSLAEAARISPRDAMLKLHSAVTALPPEDLPEPLPATPDLPGASWSSQPPAKPLPPIPTGVPLDQKLGPPPAVQPPLPTGVPLDQKLGPPPAVQPPLPTTPQGASVSSQAPAQTL